MKHINDKISELLEEKSFDALTAGEQEMVLSVMTAEAYDEQYELLQKAQHVFEEEQEFIEPDMAILTSLKKQFETKRTKEPIKPSWVYRKVSLYKSAAAVVLAILGSYAVFGRRGVIKEYVIQEKLVQQQVHDTVFKEKIVEVPVEKVVRVVSYKAPPKQKISQRKASHFAMRKEKRSNADKTIELEEGTSFYGNTKINEADLEQFRVSL